NLEAHLVIENLRASAGDRVESGIAQPLDGVFDRQSADFGDADDLRSGKAMHVHLREALLQSAEDGLVPLDLQVGMQTALQQNAGASQLHRLAHLFVDGLEVQNIPFSS